MERSIELFAIFGGLDVTLDCTKTTQMLILEHIIQNYEQLALEMDKLLLYDKNAKKLLAALARNDRKIFSSFKKAHLNNLNGGIALDFLQRHKLLHVEHSREEDKRKLKPKLKKTEAKHRISDKFFITYPFVRFWFWFIFPHVKELQRQNYTPVLQMFQKEQTNFTSFVFEQLSAILLDYYLQEEQIESLASYWDADMEIDILAKTKNEHIYLAECKWSNHSISKKELNKLEEKAKQLKIEPKQFLLFAKRGFSKELYSLEGEKVGLFSSDDFSLLLKTRPKNEYFPLHFL